MPRSHIILSLKTPVSRVNSNRRKISGSQKKNIFYRYGTVWIFFSQYLITYLDAYTLRTPGIEVNSSHIKKNGVENHLAPVVFLTPDIGYTIFTKIIRDK